MRFLEYPPPTQKQRKTCISERSQRSSATLSVGTSTVAPMIVVTVVVIVVLNGVVAVVFATQTNNGFPFFLRVQIHQNTKLKI